jgi:hypothetical protein
VRDALVDVADRAADQPIQVAAARVGGLVSRGLDLALLLLEAGVDACLELVERAPQHLGGLDRCVGVGLHRRSDPREPRVEEPPDGPQEEEGTPLQRLLDSTHSTSTGYRALMRTRPNVWTLNCAPNSV